MLKVVSSRRPPVARSIDFAALADVQRRLFAASLAGAGADALIEAAMDGAAHCAPAALWRISIDADGAARKEARHSPGFPERLLKRIAEEPGDDPIGEVSARPIACFDVRNETLWRRHAAMCLAHGARSFLVEPIRAGERTRGAIALYSPVVMDADSGEAIAARGIAESLGMALQAVSQRAADQTSASALKSLSRAMPGVVYQRLVTASGDIRYTYISDGAREMFGVEPALILSDPEALFQHYDDEYRRAFRARLMEASRKMEKWDVEATIRLPDGTTRFTHAIARPEKRADGSVLWTGVILDAGRIKAAEAAAAAAEASTRTAIVESLTQGMLLFGPDDRLIVANSHFFDLFPHMSGIVLPGLSYADYARAEDAALADMGLLSDGDIAARAARLVQRDKRASICERRLSDDRWVMVTETSDHARGSTILYTDVSELKIRERKIHHLAYHDALTGLPNRSSFRKHLADARELAASQDETTAVLCLDLDGFKFVNDTLGHPAGDRLLMEVANRLKGVIRAGDMVARLGGDEFAVVVGELPSPEYATSLAWRILDAIAKPFDIDGQHVMATTSIGIAIAPAGQHVDIDHLIKNADLALYRAKADGRNAFRFFEPEMDARAQTRRALEQDLRRALAKDELELFYQPLVDAFTEQVTGMEALLRWRHPERGLVPPVEFITLAEETGLIIKIGAWVMRRACADAARWPAHIRVAVNVSPAQFLQKDLLEIVSAALSDSGLSPSRLEIEVTESLLLRDTAANLGVLLELKALGIRISMDDFGTGYSSLANLRSFPFDKIKIDKSFVDGLESNPDSAAIVRAVLSLGRGLGMTTTAEGVENIDQLAYLRAEGCLQVQGYYFSQAVPSQDVAALLAAGVARPVSARG